MISSWIRGDPKFGDWYPYKKSKGHKDVGKKAM